jgi:hypothetical protein
MAGGTGEISVRRGEGQGMGSQEEKRPQTLGTHPEFSGGSSGGTNGQSQEEMIRGAERPPMARGAAKISPAAGKQATPIPMGGVREILRLEKLGYIPKKVADTVRGVTVGPPMNKSAGGLEGQVNTTIHQFGKKSEVISMIKEKNTIGEKLMEAEKRLGNSWEP